MANSFGVSDEHLEKVRSEILQIDGVQGLGESLHEGRPVLKAFFLDHISLNRSGLGEQLNGIPIISVVTGIFESRSPSDEA